MEQVSIYNSIEIEGLRELLGTIDCEIAADEHFIIVVNNDEIAEDPYLKEAMMSAVAKGAKIIVIWPPDGNELALPEILRQLRTALIQFDAEALHDVICKKTGRNDVPSGGQYPAPKTDRHCC
ncbi:hypothetical protein K3175_00465 [Qipengyuania sp. GH1]|uniref:hypothetical protein n=1 Tax=Qipengyuania aestuarii TaxID=2867241 RepID=UPI001C87D5CB|nr:hypothetical protein [Qipengyuania aestuarii]MBX7534123.1 hypothetical protein [Qipengyuania aestuarii]